MATAPHVSAISTASSSGSSIESNRPSHPTTTNEHKNAQMSHATSRETMIYMKRRLFVWFRAGFAQEILPVLRCQTRGCIRFRVVHCDGIRIVLVHLTPHVRFSIFLARNRRIQSRCEHRGAAGQTDDVLFPSTVGFRLSQVREPAVISILVHLLNRSNMQLCSIQEIRTYFTVKY